MSIYDFRVVALPYNAIEMLDEMVESELQHGKLRSNDRKILESVRDALAEVIDVSRDDEEE